MGRANFIAVLRLGTLFCGAWPCLFRTKAGEFSKRLADTVVRRFTETLIAASDSSPTMVWQLRCSGKPNWSHGLPAALQGRQPPRRRVAVWRAGHGRVQPCERAGARGACTSACAGQPLQSDGAMTLLRSCACRLVDSQVVSHLWVCRRPV